MPLPGHGVDVPGGHRLAVERAGAGRHHPDPVVAGVGDHQVARRRPPPPRPGCRARRWWPGRRRRRTRGAVAGDGVDVPGGHRLAVERAGAGRHHPDPVVAGVGDHQVPGGVDRHAVRAVAARRWWPGRRRRRTRRCRRRRRCRCPRRSSPGRRRCRCWPPPPGPGRCRCRRSPGCPAASTATPTGSASSALVAGPPSPENPKRAVAGDGVDVPGGHRLAVEGAGAGAPTTRTRLLPCRRSAGSPRRPPPRPPGRRVRRWWPGRRRRRTRRCRCRRRCRCPRRSSAGRRRCRCWPRPPGPGCCRCRRSPGCPRRPPPRPAGKSSSALVAGPPSPENPRGAVAGDGVDVPGGHRLRRRTCRCWPPPPGPGCCRCRRSPGCRRRPPPRPCGAPSSALVAGPPSPENPQVPLPATV